MKVKTLSQVNDRTAGGHVYSAGEGAVTVVDDADPDMVALMRKLAAAGLIEIVDDAAEHKPAETQTETKTAPAKATTRKAG